MKIRLPHRFEPREYQVPLLEAVDLGYKRGVAIWHRRAGKDKTLVNIISMQSFKRVGSYYYFFPTYKQGRKIIWDGMDKEGFPFLGHFPRELIDSKNSTEMKIKFINGSVFQVVGSDSIDSIVGTNPVGCIFSEYSLQDPRGWDFVRPILRENGGWALFNFTPRGKNWGWDIYQMALSNPDWFCEVLTVRETGVITREEIDMERAAGMDEDLIQQEFYCSFEAATQGAYYADQFRVIREEGRITNVPYQKNVLVDTWWDLGVDDSTSIWFTQNCGREIHVIDYYEASGEGLAHYAEVLKEKDYLYGRHVAPHDIKVRELGTGKSRLEQALSLGIRFEVAPKLPIEDGIENVRSLLGICWFDEKNTRRGVDGLSQYRKDYDSAMRIFKSRPVHDWTSHPADAFRTLGVSHSFTGMGCQRRTIKKQSIGGWV